MSTDSVLHRLAAELYSIVYPAISTWGFIRGLMAANETEWSLPLSYELPEGLSDELPKGGRESKIEQEDINRMRTRYQIPDDVVLRIPDPDERACCPKYEGDVAFYKVDFQAGIRFPLQPFVRKLLDYLFSSAGFKHRDMETRIVHGLPSSNRSWKDGYVFVCGDKWERLPREESSEDFVKVRRTYVEANTMKLNKGKLRKFAQSGEVVAALASLKHKEGGRGAFETGGTIVVLSSTSSRYCPLAEVRDATAIYHQSPHVAMSKAKNVVSPRDMDDYFTVHTENVHYLLIHSLMRGLNEAMMMSQRCIAGEENLAALRAKLITDEVEMKNTKRAVAKLTRDRKEALIELEKVRMELKARDDDVKVTVEAKDKAVADLQHLVGQIEGVMAAAVSKFRVSEAFDDINTRYFLFGFEAFRK
uniref:Uncharacterized protein n=1 Tax=Fagus sylvatica TaxID=28930 RepID=A0A2N9HI27_FAGSY